MAHTPGPWTAEVPHPLCVAEAPPFWITDGERRIADIRTQSNGGTVSNAHLIAAAPDLLERARIALGYLDHMLERKTDADAVCAASQLRAAIARATGE